LTEANTAVANPLQSRIQRLQPPPERDANTWLQPPPEQDTAVVNPSANTVATTSGARIVVTPP